MPEHPALRIGFLCPSLSRKAGGIYEIMLGLAKELQSQERTQVMAYGVSDDAWQEARADWSTIPADCFDRRGPGAFGWSPGLRDRVLSEDIDILHLHALWMYTSVLAAKWKKRTRRPLVVTPNGMLEPWARSNSAWKKRIAGLLYERDMLSRANVLQANTQKERDDLRSFGLRNPVAIIPNGVYLPATERRGSDGPRTLLYLGRLHHKKGILELLSAWAKSLRGSAGNWRLVVAGWGSNETEATFRQRIAELSLAESVRYVGPRFGQEKAATYREADAFILPSHSEGLPMAVLEAWAYSLPVLMTDHCNLPEGFQRGAAVRIEPTADSIEAGLQSLFEMSDEELRGMGGRGRRLVEERFVWSEVAGKLRSVYEWTLSGGPPPGFIEA
ncbi:MAG: glycosyltransferase [Planctomycetales bacterium]|nr:glycosyltransferase [Planctomycetales bacterium]